MQLLCFGARIAQRIESHFRVQRLISGKDGVVAEKPGVAVGRRARGYFRGDIAARAGAVVDDDLLSLEFTT